MCINVVYNCIFKLLFTGQMWSSAGAQTGPLVMLGGGDSDGMGVEDDPSKSQLTVQEEVELLVQQEP